ncbi:oxalate oxidase 1-like [Papaver somniferum]|uniref:oxalate oxidase 1-like n=1 Tax=Papaver somniferum TaxID=3469 RepID=UPI000E7049EA|nr:oxalate oxidase 1-like [Papaver somniferum]
MFQRNKPLAAKFSIKTTSSFFLVLYSSVILFFTLTCFSADPDPLQDICVADLKSKIKVNGYPCKPQSQATSEDFFYSGLVNGASTDTPFGFGVKRGDVKNFPGLNTQGLSVNRVDIAPGGVIPFHVHPRASEANFVLKGECLVGFITTPDTDTVLYSKVRKVGELSIIPKGLVHIVVNVGWEKAVLIAIFNSQLPGIAEIPNNLFNSTPPIPDYILAKNFRVDEKIIATIKSKFRNQNKIAKI